MIIKSTNDKINKIIDNASTQAERAFLEEILEHVVNIPDGEIENVLIMNSIIIGISKILAGLIYQTVLNKENHDYALETFLEAITQNTNDLLETIVTSE